MAQLKGGFVPDSNDQWTGFEVLPAGEYKVQIVDTDICETKAGDGEYIKLVYEVIGDPMYQGRKIFDNLNIVNPSADAVRIGRQKLNTICALVGLKTIKDTVQLHGKTMTILVAVTKNKNTGDDSNQVKKYLPFTGAKAAPVAQEADAEEVPKGKKSFLK